jgi:transcriptional regulator with XRE-family HTH domain
MGTVCVQDMRHKHAGSSSSAPQTLGQLLQQARLLLGFTLQDVAARVHREDGQPLSPQYLHKLERDQTRPSLRLAHELATVLALDTVLLLTLAHRADALVWRYLQARPDAEMALIDMLLTAEQRGFVGWERVTRQFVAPDLLSSPRCRQRISRGRMRRASHARHIQPPPECSDH